MATKIRLKRIGRRNRPFYRMVIMDARNRRDGAAIEELGWYNPLDSNKQFELKDERIIHWLSEGAEPTKAAKKILRHSGITHYWHLMKKGLSKSEIEKEMKKWELNREDVLKNRIEKTEKQEKEKTKQRNDGNKKETLDEDSKSSSEVVEAVNSEKMDNANKEQASIEDSEKESNEEE